MNLVDEEHIALVEIADDCRKIARPFYRWSRGYAQVNAEFTRNDMGQRRLAQAGWS